MQPGESGVFQCPVTGRQWESRPEWVVTHARSSFRFHVLDGQIVLCRTFGSTSREDVEVYIATLESIIAEFRADGRQMVLMEDYTQLHETDGEARKVYTDYHIQYQERWKGILFFGMNPFLKLLMRLSKRILPLRLTVEAWGSYAQALARAGELLGRPLEPFSVAPQESGKGWHSAALNVEFVPLDELGVLRVRVHGRLLPEEVQPLFRAYESFLAEQSPPPGKWFRLIDYSGLVSWDTTGLWRVLREFHRIDHLFPPRLRLVRGIPRDLRARMAIGWLRWMGSLAEAETEGELLEIVRRVRKLDSPHRGVSRIWHNFLDRVFRHDEVLAHGLMVFIGELQWDVAGSGQNPYPEGHPFHKVADSLLVVKSDFDDLFLERDRRERELEAARERAEEVNRLQARFLANVSHEIRTPLNAVLGMGELLGDTRLDARQTDLLRTLRQSAQGLLGVINDILDLSRMEAGEFRLSSEPFDLGSLLDEVGGMIGYLASTRGLEFRMERAPDLPKGLQGDAIRIRQILVNLAGNAVKFTDSGGVVVRVRASGTRDPDLLHMSMEVEDSGPGIPPEKVEELFRPFKQLDGSFTRRHGGTGLGLAIARNLAERMGGGISVHAGPVRGTIFRFEAILARAEPPPTSVDTSQDDSRRMEGRVLLAEDNRVNQRVAIGLLSKLGIETIAVDNGRMALETLKRRAGDFRCVLMDIQMPVMDGLEAVRRIRAGEVGEVAAKLPMLALTAHAMDGDREVFLKAGMDGYLSKPIRLGQLRQALEAILLESE
ncbi:MAG: response regulator [Fibrobacteria bacterium]|nr:response regulator [Fibrobacteria bacterium]